jgi:hypothetical protein
MYITLRGSVVGHGCMVGPMYRSCKLKYEEKRFLLVAILRMYYINRKDSMEKMVPHLEVLW